MTNSRKKNIIRFCGLTLSVLLVAVLIAAVPVSAAAAYTASVDVNQTFTVYRPYGLRVPDSFTYKLTALNGAPVENEQTFTLSGNSGKRLEFSFDRHGDYEYQLKLSQSVKQKNYSYDSAVYRIRIYTKEDEPVIIIYNEKGSKVASILYRHSYTEPYVPPTPKTGDDFSIVSYGLLLLFSAAGFAVIIRCCISPARGRRR